MGWKQRISVVVVVVIAAVPLSSALCALACGSSADTASAHHGSESAQDCNEPASPSTGVQIEAVSEHDCNAHGAAVVLIATAAAGRAALQVAPALSGLLTGHTAIDRVPTGLPIVENTSPPGWALPAIPLILRV